MKITIAKEVFDKFNPHFEIAFVMAEELDNHSKLKESLHLLHDAEKLIQLTFNKDTVKSHLLVAPWAAAQFEFGDEARHYHTSVENLLHHVLMRKKINGPETLSNLLRYLSLKCIVPITADDFEKIEGNLTFNLALGKEKMGWFKVLQKKSLFYKDDKDVLGTHLDFWKNSKTILGKKTTSALIHIPILPPLNNQKRDALLQELRQLVKVFCGGKTKVVILSQKKNSVTI